MKIWDWVLFLPRVIELLRQIVRELKRIADALEAIFKYQSQATHLGFSEGTTKPK